MTSLNASVSGENELPVLEPNFIEKAMIKKLEDLYPNLDYLMCLTLVKSSETELQEIRNMLPEKMEYKPNTSTLIKGGITIE
jgi:hypothetical protein